MNEIAINIKGGRNHSVDLMKFFAAILITNSHMATLYPVKYALFATGGAIGDALFFFCSGFCLMMGSNTDFFNWYKRRVNRIFPTIFAVALIGIVFKGNDPTLKEIITRGGGWFIRAIFLFYAVFWFVKRFLLNKLWIAYAINSVFVLIWFFFFWDKSIFIFHYTYIKWPIFFMVMLMGASMYNYEQKLLVVKKKRSGWLYLVLLIVFLLFYYGYQLIWNYYSVLKNYQIVLLLPLMGIVFAIYKLCLNDTIIRVYESKYLKWALYGISACCLEIYLSGAWCFGIGRRLIYLFPLNVIVVFFSIFVLAYTLKVFSNFLSQTFRTEKYDWKGMVKL